MKKTDIWDEKPTSHPPCYSYIFTYSAEDMDAWLEKLKEHYGIADTWMELLKDVWNVIKQGDEDHDGAVKVISDWKEKSEKWDNFYEKIRPTLEKAEILEALTPVWVPRGYFSEAKIKDDDVLMYIQENSEFTTNSEEVEQ